MSKAAVLDTLTQVGTVVNALGNLTVGQGRTRYGDLADSEDDVRMLDPEVAGKFWYWLDQYNGSNQTNPTEITIRCIYECKVLKDQSSTLQDFVGKLMDIITALQKETNFTKSRPEGVVARRADDDLEDRVMQWELDARFMLGPTC